MLLQRVLVPLGFQHGQRLDQFLARLARLDDGVHKAPFRCDVGIGEPFAELFDFFFAKLLALGGAV